MARHKPLKSVARSIAHSFTSGLNYEDDDYVMGHLVEIAQRTGSSAFEIDILSGQSRPAELLSQSVLESIESYRSRFRDLVTRSQSDPGFVASARMRIDFDLARTKPLRYRWRTHESPYACTVTIVDDRGKQYSASVTGWWAPGPVRRSASLWTRIRKLWAS
jgi:hypothetical protein